MENREEKNVLVIDDYFLIRRNHKLLLEKLGFNVIEATDGADGLKKIEKYGIGHFSLIIVDLMMPEMSGAEFIISCKEKWEGEIPPVMVCSSASEVPLVKKIASMGIAGYIVKPVDYRTLIDKLKKMFPEIRDFRAKK